MPKSSLADLSQDSLTGTETDRELGKLTPLQRIGANIKGGVQNATGVARNITRDPLQAMEDMRGQAQGRQAAGAPSPAKEALGSLRESFHKKRDEALANSANLAVSPEEAEAAVSLADLVKVRGG